MTKKKILVVAAHPDDEVLGCGATVALKVKQEFEAHLLIMATGVLGRTEKGEISSEMSAGIENLKKESDRAAALIGFTSVQKLDFPDNRMDTVGRMDVAHSIKKVLEKIRPDIIYTHHPGDYNWDHTITFDAVMMAARSSPGECAPSEILSFEVASSTERGFQNGDRAFHPTVYVNIESTMETKKQALIAYSSECKEYPHPRSPEGVEYLARKRGSEIGIRYAEAFALIRRTE